MEMQRKCTCENCGRSNNIVEINRVSVRGHIAALCTTCANVFAEPSNGERFFKFVREKDRESSNEEMKKVHTLMTNLLLIGMFFIVVVAAFGVSQNLISFPGEIFSFNNSEEQVEYISFQLLNQFK